jgi:hypothetical protein
MFAAGGRGRGMFIVSGDFKVGNQRENELES